MGVVESSRKIDFVLAVLVGIGNQGQRTAKTAVEHGGPEQVPLAVDTIDLARFCPEDQLRFAVAINVANGGDADAISCGIDLQSQMTGRIEHLQAASAVRHDDLQPAIAVKIGEHGQTKLAGLHGTGELPLTLAFLVETIDRT